MTYPAWFPYPIAWVKALKTSIPTFVGGTIIGTVEAWRYGVWTNLLLISVGEPISVLPLFMGLVFLIASFLWHLMIMGLYQLFLRLLWSKPPKWTKPSTLSGVCLGWGIAVIATLVGATIAFHALPIFWLDTPEKPLMELIRQSHRYHRAVSWLFGFWLVAAAYLYQCQFIMLRRQSRHRA